MGIGISDTGIRDSGIGADTDTEDTGVGGSHLKVISVQTEELEG